MTAGNRREEDFEVPWPALVDLLTSVLITFMFFILITAVAMSTMTTKTIELIRQESEQKAKEGAASCSAENMAKTEQEKNRLEQENKQLQQQLANINDKLAYLQAPLNQAKQINVMQEDKAITLAYLPNEVGMLPDIASKIKMFVKSTSAQKVEIIAEEPNALTVSIARQQALARTLNIRNILLESNLRPENITITFAPYTPSSSQHDWVKLKVLK